MRAVGGIWLSACKDLLQNRALRTVPAKMPSFVIIFLFFALRLPDIQHQRNLHNINLGKKACSALFPKLFSSIKNYKENARSQRSFILIIKYFSSFFLLPCVLSAKHKSPAFHSLLIVLSHFLSCSV